MLEVSLELLKDLYYDSDTDGFVIPSLSVGDTDLSNQDVPEQIDVKYLPKVWFSHICFLFNFRLLL